MKIVSKIFLFIILALLTAEGILRIQEQMLDPVEKYQSLLLRKYVNQVFWVVSNPDKVEFFQPPNPTFANTGYDDDKRLKEIYRQTLGPVGTSARVTDVLEPDSDEKFLISLDSQGFRGVERIKNFPADYHRIVVLGSYQAFGVGVNDDETYSIALEDLLDGGHEVLNAGRMSSSAIVGLAHLKNNVINRYPDLVILDYGFVDSTMVDEFSGQKVDEERARAGYYKYFSSSYLLQKFRNKVWHPEPASVQGFISVMDEMLKLLRQLGIPVIVVKQNFHFAFFDPYFSELEKRGIPVVNVAQAFQNNPPTKDDWNNVPWLREVPPEYRQKIPFFRFGPYYKNPFQLSVKGHAVLAAELKRVIQEKGILK